MTIGIAGNWESGATPGHSVTWVSQSSPSLPPQAELLAGRPPASRFAAQKASHKHNCCQGGPPQADLQPGRPPQADLRPRRLPTSRITAREASQKQICCPGASPLADLLPESLPTSRFGAREASTYRFQAISKQGCYTKKLPTSRFTTREVPTGRLHAKEAPQKQF